MRIGFGFSSVTFRPSRTFHYTDRVLEVARIFTKHSKCCDKFLVLTMSAMYNVRFYFAILYKQELQYTLLKSFTVPSAF